MKIRGIARMSRSEVFRELQIAMRRCAAMDGFCLGSTYIHDSYALICDYKGVTVHVVVPDTFNRHAVLRRVLAHQLRFIPIGVSRADGIAIATPILSSLAGIPPVGLRYLGGSVSRPTAAP